MRAVSCCFDPITAGHRVGWLNMLGQVALTASVDSCLANHIAAMWSIYNGHTFCQEELLLCYTGAASQSLSCMLLCSCCTH